MASAAPLPQPMLARSGPIPTRGQWAYEVKWDGFRAIVSTENELQVRSRRGWNMTELVPELSALPVFATLDGELVAFGPDGTPDFPTLCERMLMRRRGISITYVVFDVLTLNGGNLTGLPYSGRRAVLESLNLNGTCWITPATFDDGEALFAAVQEQELEGIVAKRLSSRYSPAVRGWVKIKNRNYWRYEIERESAISKRRQRTFV